MPVLSTKRVADASTTHAVAVSYAGSVADAALDLARVHSRQFGGSRSVANPAASFSILISWTLQRTAR